LPAVLPGPGPVRAAGAPQPGSHGSVSVRVTMQVRVQIKATKQLLYASWCCRSRQPNNNGLLPAWPQP